MSLHAGALWLVLLLSGSFGFAQAALVEGRVDRELNTGWRFKQGEIQDGAAVTLDDRDWQTVDLPHTWNVVDGTNPAGYYRGPGWYRLHFSLDSGLEGKSLFLRFGAASLVAQVFVNGQEVGRHSGGFSAFCLEITEACHGGSNVFAVRVDNRLNPDVSPLSGDFTVYGGLYRGVHLLALEPISISPLDDASCGVYLRTTVVGGEGRLIAAVKLRNSAASEQKCFVRVGIHDAQDRVVSQRIVEAKLSAQSQGNAEVKLEVPRVHLWNGVKDPYLYRAVVELLNADRKSDEIQQAFGFRTISITAADGLLLNGRPFDVHGVNYHQGRVPAGFADTAAMKAQDFALMAELGCTGMRMAHYQHSDEDYELADRHGILVWAELALVNRVTKSDAFFLNCEQQFRELIKQEFNHPSVFVWSMYNELWTKPDVTDLQVKLLQRLQSVARTLDPDRLTAGAAAPGNEDPIGSESDVLGINRYFGWYAGGPETWNAEMEKLRAKYSGRRIGISEYGAGASVNQHEAIPGHPKPASLWHPEEWQCLVHESAWPAIDRTPGLWCKFVWTMFDLASNSRNEGDRPGINDKGLVTGDRTIRKDAYFYYQACWSSAPLVHITGSRFTPRKSDAYAVKVYSNRPEIELIVNGKSRGVKSNQGNIFVWENVRFETGIVILKAVSPHTNSGPAISDEIQVEVK